MATRYPVSDELFAIFCDDAHGSSTLLDRGSLATNWTVSGADWNLGNFDIFQAGTIQSSSTNRDTLLGPITGEPPAGGGSGWTVLWRGLVTSLPGHNLHLLGKEYYTDGSWVSPWEVIGIDMFSSGTLQFNVYTSSGLQSYTSPASIPVGIDVTVIMTYDGTTLNAYVNGAAPVVTATPPGTFSSYGTHGHWYSNSPRGTSSPEPLPAMISELRLFPSVKDGAWISNYLAYGTIQTSTAGYGFANDANTLAVYYPWERADPFDKVIDHGPYGMHLFNINGLAIGQAKAPFGTGPRMDNGSLGFTSGITPSAFKTAMASGPWTVEWVHTQTDGVGATSQALIQLSPNDGTRAIFDFYGQPTSSGSAYYPRNYWTTNDSSGSNSDQPWASTQDTAYFVWGGSGNAVATYYNAITYQVITGVGHWDFYINNKHVGTVTGTPIDTAIAARPNYIDLGNSGGQSAHATFGSIRISNKVRSAGEMTQAFNDAVNFTGKTRENWPFESALIMCPNPGGFLSNGANPPNPELNGCFNDLSPNLPNTPWGRLGGGGSTTSYATGPGGLIGRVFYNGTVEFMQCTGHSLVAAIGATGHQAFTLDTVLKQTSLYGISGTGQHSIFAFNTGGGTNAFLASIEPDGRIRALVVTNGGAGAGSWNVYTTNPVFPSTHFIHVKFQFDFVSSVINIYTSDLGTNVTNYTPGPLTLVGTGAIQGYFLDPFGPLGGGDQVPNWYYGTNDGSRWDYISGPRVKAGLNTDLYPAISNGPAAITFSSISCTNNVITLTFSENVTLSASNTLSQWLVSPTDPTGVPLSVQSVTTAGKTVLVTTSKQTISSPYQIIIPAGMVIGQVSGSSYTGSTQSFTGSATRETLTAAWAPDLKDVEVVFTGPVSNTDAINPVNYAITGGTRAVTITGIQQMNSAGTSFKLSVTNTQPSTNYTITASNIKDVARNTIS